MKRIALVLFLITALCSFLASCGGRASGDPKAEAPPPAEVQHLDESGIYKVKDPGQFPLATVGEYNAAPALNVTGVVSADVSRQIPVISLASGRIVEVHARLGDTVHKGQLLLKVQSADISTAYSEYEQAIADEALARSQYERSQLLYDKGAIAKKDLEVAEDAETKAKVTIATSREHLKILGADPNHPSAIVDVFAPQSGVITDQQVTAASGTQGLASPNPFVISDLSSVWVMCDVYENDLPQIHLGDFAEVRLNAYPDQLLKGRIGNISPVLDPNLHTAKVRLELRNPGLMKIGMFVTATFHGLKRESHPTVPAAAILHLHDRDWVYVPNGNAQFRRVAVVGGATLAGNLQELKSAEIRPGDRVVANALILQNTVEQ